MAYAQGQLITAADYNALRNSVIAIYGTGTSDRGYGQSAITLSTVAGGVSQLIASSNWTNLRNAISACVSHQGGGITPPAGAALAQGQLIRAHPPASGDIPGSITSIDANRLTAAGGSLTTIAGAFTNSRATAWSTTLTLEFSATFSTGDAARYFYNSGGTHRFTTTRTGGTVNAQNTQWTNFLTSVGTIVFGAHKTTHTGTVLGNHPVGYFELTTSYQICYMGSDNGAYGGGGGYSAHNRVTLEAKSNGPVGANGDRGNIITFKLTYQDGADAYTDNMDGTFAVTVDERKATTFLTIASPSYLLVDGL